MDGRCILMLLLADAIFSITVLKCFCNNIMCLVIEPRKTEFDDPKSEQNVLSFICIYVAI